MRSQSHNNLQPQKQTKSIDIIQETRKIVKRMTEKQRFKKAKRHLQDALCYKTPRLDTYNPEISRVLKYTYRIQTSTIWQTFLLILAYVFMYMIAVNLYPVTNFEKGLEISIMVVMWLDVCMEIYHKKFEVLRITSRFQTRFYFRVAILCALFIDEVLYFISHEDQPIRVFLVLRCFMPLFYDSTARKAFQALISSYKDIFVYIFFYSLIIVGFAVVCNQVIQLPQGTEYDQFVQHYGDLGKTIFIIYVLSSYDAYPDNQLVAIRSSVYIYGLFVGFIILNVLFFVTIPTTILFNSFRETRSKTLLIDEIKQQHSLIMAFVSLGEDNLNISQQKLIRFLLYVYKNKVRYVDYITEVCLELDDNSNGQIQVNQFMQLCKILQSNHSMLPPTFHDWEKWLQFRSFINTKFMLKSIIISKAFKIATGIFIILTFINCTLALFTEVKAFDIIDDVFMGIYCLEIFLKIIGLGPQNYFRDPWNNMDFFLIIIGLVFQLTPDHLIPRNSDVLFKMTRIFRITILIRLLTENNGIHSEVYVKSKRLISQMVIIIPVVVRFMPLYFISYYILGVLGIQIFENLQHLAPQQSPYSDYHQYSNFDTFLGSQFVFVQVLVEAGWSAIAYDHAYRYNNFAGIMIYFVISHLTIVIVLSSLLKGIAWQVYSAVHDQFNDRTLQHEKKVSKQTALKKKKQKFEQIKARIDLKQLLLPNDLITRELYENRIDLEIFKKLKNMYDRNQMSFSRQDKRKRSGIVSHIIEDRNIMFNQIFGDKKMKVDEIQLQSQSENANDHYDMTINRLMQSLNLQDIQDLTEEDIEQQMEKVLGKIILHHKITYFEVTAYPSQFIEFLDSKLYYPLLDQQRKGFDIEKDSIGNKQSINFLTYQLNVLLNIEKSEREQKALIIKNMVKDRIITEQQSVKVLTKKLNEKDESFDSHWIMRKMFLCGTNQLMIKKFEIEYFSSVYGKSFKEINKVTIEPLLRLQSRLEYCLRNVLRYRQIEDEQFFTILSTIEDSISNKLLKKGSLFKFVYQIDSVSQNWFSIQLRQSKQLKIHFIKSGLWVYNKSMPHNQFKYGRDIFHWNIHDRSDKNVCQKYIKRFFQAFQSLAFCLFNQKNFFESDPHRYIYDLFTFYRDVSDNIRFVDRKLSISKIMLVILSKEQERDQPLDYQLTDLNHEETEQDKRRKQLIFKFDQSENQTFKKLKKIQLFDYEKIVETEGLPFAYIINMMSEIRDILKLYENNFIYQVEKALNREFEDLQ